MLSPITRKIVAALATRSSLGARLLSAWATLSADVPVDARTLTAAAGLSVAEEQGAEQLLRSLAAAGLAEPADNGYRVTAAVHVELAGAATSLAAIDFYQSEIHEDETAAQVVLTRPSHATELEARLMERGWRTAAIEPTERAFMSLVRQARRRLVVMTPFLDERGAEWLQELLKPLPASVALTLVLRSLEDRSRSDYPLGFNLLADWLAERGVTVVNYSRQHIPRQGRETFHAKVILADTTLAYVGSVNLTQASRDYSMELGVVLRGRAAGKIGEVVEAVIGAGERVL